MLTYSEYVHFNANIVCSLFMKNLLEVVVNLLRRVASSFFKYKY